MPTAFRTDKPTMGRAARTFWPLVGLLALCAGGKAILYDTIDPDCFWHLRVAEQLTRDGVGSLVDQLSFASLQQPWTPYSWLAELAMKFLWDTCGWRGAILASAVLNAAFILLLAMLCIAPVRCDSTSARPGHTTALLTTAILGFIALPYLSFRPATLAIVLLAVIAHLLQQLRSQPQPVADPTRQPARANSAIAAKTTILLLTALLANIHLFAFLVPLWLIVLHIGDRIDRRRAVLSPGFILAAVAASCATPMLPGVIQTLLHYQFHDPMVASGLIVEMQPFWKGTMGAAAALLVIALLAGAGVNWRRWTTADRLMLALAMVLLLSKGRYAPLFALTAAPVFAIAWPSLADRAIARPSLRFAAILLVAVGLVRLSLAFPVGVTMDAWLSRHVPEVRGYPTGAASFVQHNIRPIHGRIFNDFTSGGYLAWRLNPAGFKVLLDGRTQVYSDQFWKSVYLGDVASRKHVLSRHTVDAAILPLDERTLAPCLLELGWTIAWRDAQSQVLLPPAPARHSLANVK